MHQADLGSKQATKITTVAVSRACGTGAFIQASLKGEFTLRQPATNETRRNFAPSGTSGGAAEFAM
jgi:hypothetical protein